MRLRQSTYKWHNVNETEELSNSEWKLEATVGDIQVERRGARETVFSQCCSLSSLIYHNWSLIQVETTSNNCHVLCSMQEENMSVRNFSYVHEQSHFIPSMALSRRMSGYCKSQLVIHSPLAGYVVHNFWQDGQCDYILLYQCRIATVAHDREMEMK